MASPNIKLEVVPTPNPSEVALRVWQDANQMGLDSIPTIGQSYIDTGLPVRPKMEEFKNYVYVYMSKERDDVWFYFAKPKTVIERNTPFRTTFSTRQYPWPGVLYNIDIYKTVEFPQSTNNGSGVVTAPRYFSKYRFKPTPNVSSVVKIEEFLAEVPYPQSVLTHIQPIPTDISGDFLGLSINFPRCLHPKVAFDTNVPGAQKIVGQGTVEVNGLWNPSKQIFPATNFLDWAPFILEDDVRPVNGQFYRSRITIYPPIPPEEQLI